MCFGGIGEWLSYWTLMTGTRVYRWKSGFEIIRFGVGGGMIVLSICCRISDTGAPLLPKQCRLGDYKSHTN